MGTVLDKKNDILYFDKEEKKVKIQDNCLNFPEVKYLFRRDKSLGKKYFEKCINYCYYINHLDSPIIHQPLSIKIKNVLLINDGMLANFDPENNAYKKFEEFFIENHLSTLEIRYNKLIKDIDDLIEHLTDIPLYKKIKMEVNVNTTECLNGEIVDVAKKVMIDQFVDNSNEKTKAISNIKSLDDLKEMLIKKIKIEYSKKDNGTRRYFDR